MKKEETKLLLSSIDNSIITMDNVSESMLQQFRAGKEPGSKTYIRAIDEVTVTNSRGSFNSKAWSWRPGEFNIWTGYNNEGKSQALIYLCLLKALNEDKKFAFFSPENFPPDDFFDDIIHSILGKTTDKKAKGFDMTEKEYFEAMNRIKNNFFFVYPKDENGNPDFTIEEIEKVFEYLIWEHDVFAVIVDPYIKIRHRMDPGEPEHLYASRFMMDRINFTRKNNVSYHLVMHQTTPRKEKDGNYPRPNLYSIKGGGTFADSSDNVLSIWRPYRGTDPLNTEILFISEKIKKQKLVGIPSDITMNFSRQKNRYLDMNGFDFMDGSMGESMIKQKEETEERQMNYHRNDVLKNSNAVNEFDNLDKAPF